MQEMEVDQTSEMTSNAKMAAEVASEGTEATVQVFNTPPLLLHCKTYIRTLCIYFLGNLAFWFSLSEMSIIAKLIQELHAYIFFFGRLLF